MPKWEWFVGVRQLRGSIYSEARERKQMYCYRVAAARERNRAAWGSRLGLAKSKIKIGREIWTMKYIWSRIISQRLRAI